MLRFAPYILKSLWRRCTRTLLTLVGTAAAIFVATFVMALQEGLGRLHSSRQQERMLISFQANRFCPSTSKLPQDYAQRVLKIEGVQEAVPIKVFMNNCRASLDVVVFNGLPAEKLRTVRALDLVEGDWNDFYDHQDSAVVGQGIARRRGLRVGQRFSIGMLTVTVTGIFRSDDSSTDGMIFTHLDFLQRTKGLDSVGTVTQLEIQLEEDADPQEVCKAVDKLFQMGPVATNTRTKGAFQANATKDLAELVRFTQLLGFACMGLILLLIGGTTLMSVQDRIREHAIMQTLGFSGGQILGLVISESILLSAAGGLVGSGIALGALAFNHLSIGTAGVVIGFSPSPALAGSGLGLAIVLGLLAGAIPAYQASRSAIVPALRHG
jgi:putative ABC transport system permease protein